MTTQRIKELRKSLKDENISYGEIIEIADAAEALGIELTEEMLPSDHLDEIEKALA